MAKRITNEDIATLKQWLQNNEIQYKNIYRDFSDAVLLANLLKKLYPKLVELHNYPPRSNTQLKLNNWETINYKVLSKLGLQQSKIMLDKLSRGVAGAIEALLCDIMLLETEQKAKGDRETQLKEKIWLENDDIITINVNKQIGDAIVQVPQKMILYSIYEQAVRESQTKDAVISNCQQKITHLENILKLKAERIDELCSQLAKTVICDTRQTTVSNTNQLENYAVGNGSNNKGNGKDNGSNMINQSLIQTQTKTYNERQIREQDQCKKQGLLQRPNQCQKQNSNTILQRRARLNVKYRIKSRVRLCKTN